MSTDLRKAALRTSATAALRVAEGPLAAVNESGSDDAPLASSSEHMPPPSLIPSRRAAPKPATWDKYWSKNFKVDLPGRGTFNVYTAGEEGPVVLCLHGGGYTGLTWSLVAAKLKDKYRVVAPDLRGHGTTSTADDVDFSKETMSTDVVELLQALFGDSTERVPTLIVGHSMGGAIAVWAAASKAIKGLEGVVVIDVVEGTAMAALPHMTGVLASRPTHFSSLEEAISWCTRTGMCRSKEAAAVSMPSQLRQDAGSGHYVWATPLEKSRPFWEGWYQGLSDAFLAVPGPKMLLLAGTDRLDKSLTIGQMQGKFQLVLMPMAGHAIHEDEADKTAEHLLQFLTRFRIGMPPMTFPKAPAGVQRVLPVVAGPAFQP
mmetsp:Transcript_17840/g.38383  ORF Transcript_17840/g.38383 Transcript_17840/m.38383 type:complete len:374 (+) Transcript_17840:102-1223(+)|eukprot:CAMPEP_0202918600 /NCGR_PEP_ID=MMETSP1392-20130828/73841_1 /ASSEMBLY_ACC=CAM_ASM_000868 /TAXON_ID=225041 /ORGANISM="Chlamydomonas chlamydogama, Strain SAG 11-48b" /LENGTH=373 /DNA_ID=CAMNT_0049611705 /DNA_START=90 /DNA_END=1211 /DNA_ORIENTATION=+